MARRTAEAVGATPLDGVDLILADLDGVVYAGAGPIAHAVEAINAAQGSGIRVGYLTNNASRTTESVAAHLNDLGLTVVPDDVVSSPQAAVKLLADLVPPGSLILVVGGDGLTSELDRAGFRITRSAEDSPAAVIQGFAPHVAWTDLAEAAFALRAAPPREDIPWVATNTDWTIPQARGTAPGNGTLVSAVHTAVGRLPIVAGKPERAIFDAAVARFGAQHPLVIGDRLDTDILGANRSGMPSVLVLTGIDGPKQVLAAVPDQRPTFLLEDLRELDQPYPVPVVSTDKRTGDRLYTVRDAVVRHAGNQLRLEKAGRRIDILRAGTAAVWGAGVPIYALDVAPSLYE